MAVYTDLRLSFITTYHTYKQGYVPQQQQQYRNSNIISINKTKQMNTFESYLEPVLYCS